MIPSIRNIDPAGAGIKDQDRNILTNQHLILAFLRSCQPLLTRGPSRQPIDHKAGKRTHKHHQAKRRGARDEGDDGSDAEAAVAYAAGGPADEVSEDEDEDAEMTSAHDAFNAAIDAGAAKTFHPPTKQGTVLVTLKNSKPYTLWDVHHLATRPPAHPVRRRAGDPTDDKQPRYRLLRSFAFDPAMWPGYEHRRTLGFKEGVSKTANLELMQGGGQDGEAAVGMCKTWEFEPRYERERGRR